MINGIEYYYISDILLKDEMRYMPGIIYRLKVIGGKEAIYHEMTEIIERAEEIIEDGNKILVYDDILFMILFILEISTPEEKKENSYDRIVSLIKKMLVEYFVVEDNKIYDRNIIYIILYLWYFSPFDSSMFRNVFRKLLKRGSNQMFYNAKRINILLSILSVNSDIFDKLLIQKLSNNNGACGFIFIPRKSKNWEKVMDIIKMSPLQETGIISSQFFNYKFPYLIKLIKENNKSAIDALYTNSIGWEKKIMNFMFNGTVDENSFKNVFPVRERLNLDFFYFKILFYLFKADVKVIDKITSKDILFFLSREIEYGRNIKEMMEKILFFIIFYLDLFNDIVIEEFLSKPHIIDIMRYMDLSMVMNSLYYLNITEQAIWRPIIKSVVSVSPNKILKYGRNYNQLLNLLYLCRKDVKKFLFDNRIVDSDTYDKLARKEQYFL